MIIPKKSNNHPKLHWRIRIEFFYIISALWFQVRLFPGSNFHQNSGVIQELRICHCSDIWGGVGPWGRSHQISFAMSFCKITFSIMDKFGDSPSPSSIYRIFFVNLSTFDNLKNQITQLNFFNKLLR